MLGCYALSLSAKSMGVTLPFVLLLLDAWPLGRLRGAVERRVWEKVPLLAMAAAAAAVAVVAQRSVGATHALATTPADRLGNAAVSAVRYAADLFWPADLAVFYPFRPVPAAAAVAAAAVLVVVTAVALRFRRRRPYLLVGWLWFAGTLVPVIGLVQVGMQARADRYVYVPSVGLSVAVVWLAADVLGRAGPAVAAAAVAALAVAGHRQVEVWRDNRDAVRARRGRDGRQLLRLGLPGRRRPWAGRPGGAVGDLKRSLDGPGRLRPDVRRPGPVRPARGPARGGGGGVRRGRPARARRGPVPGPVGRRP